MGFAEQIWQSFTDRFGQWAVVALASVFGALAWIGFRLAVRKTQQFSAFLSSRRRALAAVAREQTADGPREGSGVWLTRPVHQPDDYKNLISSFKVLAIANLKGGVGKTTLAANIGACLASKWRLRVLLIDLDYQGSLSSMCFGANPSWLPNAGQDSLATALISGDLTPALASQVAKIVPDQGDAEGRLKLIPAYYDLAQADNRVMIEWLLRSRRAPSRSVRHALAELLMGRPFRAEDVRYTLAHILHSTAIRSAFDVVIIDCPPRLTTSEIQAFCAASHLLIPTIFDRTSAEAVVSLAQQIKTLKRENICPHIKYVGVVGSKWDSGLNAAKNSLVQLVQSIQAIKIDLPVLPTKTYLPMTTRLVRDAEDGIAYFVMGAADGQAVRHAIDTLTDHVANQMGIPRTDFATAVPLQAAQ